MNKRSGFESKKRIIDAAIKIFSQYGYSGATMRMIAKEAGISIGGVYLYFKTKEELSLFLIREKIKELDDRISHFFEDITHPAKVLKAYIKEAIDFARENRELIIMHSKEQGFTFGIEIKREFFEKEKTLLKNLIDRGIKDGEFIKCNSEEVAKLIMHIIRGYVLSVVVDPENLIDPDECVKIIFNGLLKVRRDSSGHLVPQNDMGGE